MQSNHDLSLPPSGLPDGWIRELVIAVAFLALCAVGLWAVLIPQINDEKFEPVSESSSNAGHDGAQDK